MAATVQNPHFKTASRTQESLLAPLERRALRWFAENMPRYVNSDHLTVLGALGMVGAGACFWAAGSHRWALVGVVLSLVINWFGDSLDGTLARFRNQQRPRYGFYVDHIIDAVGALCLLGGLGLSGFMSPTVAMAVLLAFYLLSIEAYLATYTISNFRLSHFKMSPTEMRILLAIGAIQLMFKPQVQLAGHSYQLFDVGGVIAVAGMLFIFFQSAIRNIAKLYREEPLS